MDTSRGDFGIAVRSAFLRKGTQQRYSLFFLAVLCLILIFLESIDSKPLNKTREKKISKVLFMNFTFFDLDFYQFLCA